MTPEPNPLDALMPTDPLMAAMWFGALMEAIGDDEMYAAFKAETGDQFTPARTPIDKMIDQATGAEAAFVEQFARWFNRAVWGEVNGRACNGDEPEIEAVAREALEGRG